MALDAMGSGGLIHEVRNIYPVFKFIFGTKWFG